MHRVFFRVCPACGEPTTEAVVDPAARRLVCDRCGQSSAIQPLPPLLFVTGASGAGKSRLLNHLLGTVDEAILIDQDLLWGVDPAHDDPASGYRRFRGLILHLAERLARNGRPVVVEGTCMPDQYEGIGERWYFEHTAYLAVVCSDDELERRLRARPAWRGSTEHLAGMLELNRHFRAGTDPTVERLDTTDRSVEECAAELHGWIRRRVS
jgi:chloramphenicol 3-O-phosphotransferase